MPGTAEVVIVGGGVIGLMAPAVGEVLRDLYLGREPFVDFVGLSADRFADSRSRPELNIV